MTKIDNLLEELKDFKDMLYTDKTTNIINVYDYIDSLISDIDFIIKKYSENN